MPHIIVRYSIPSQPGHLAKVKEFEGNYDYEIVQGVFVVIDKETQAQHMFSLALSPTIEVFFTDDELEEMYAPPSE